MLELNCAIITIWGKKWMGGEVRRAEGEVLESMKLYQVRHKKLSSVPNIALRVLEKVQLN